MNYISYIAGQFTNDIIMKTQRQFILDTLLPYKENPSICAISESGQCQYLTEDGRKCALGRHLVDGDHQERSLGVYGMDEVYGLNNILSEEAKAQNIPILIWDFMQIYHDSIAKKYSPVYINYNITKIEDILQIELKELYV